MVIAIFCKLLKMTIILKYVKRISEKWHSVPGDS